MKIFLIKSVKIFYVKYFNGFSLQNEEKYFNDFVIKSQQCVVGFSYGAQQAFEYAYNSKDRIDRLILISPAFFQTQKQSFKRTQLHYFDAGQNAYVKQFLQNVAYPSNENLSKYLKIGTKDELESLLTYIWNVEKIEKLKNKGTIIEVFLGENDKIINTKDTYDFFSKYTTVYFIKNVGHLLQSA